MFGGDETHYQKDITALINGEFRSMLVGQEVPNVERMWSAMFDCTSLESQKPQYPYLGPGESQHQNAGYRSRGRGALGRARQSAGTAGLPASGRIRDRVPVIAIGGYYQKGKGTVEFREELLSLQRNGDGWNEAEGRPVDAKGRYRTRSDSRARYWVRSLLLPAMLIRPGRSHRRLSSAAVCRLLACAGLRSLSAGTISFAVFPKFERPEGFRSVPGQGEISGYGCRDLIASNAIDILNVDVTIAGGVTEWRRMAGNGRLLNVGMAHHEEPQAALHLLAAVPNGLYVEIFPDPERDPMWFELPERIPGSRDGYMYVPQEPGFGITLRPEIIERYRADGVSASVAV